MAYYLITERYLRPVRNAKRASQIRAGIRIGRRLAQLERAGRVNRPLAVRTLAENVGQNPAPTIRAARRTYARAVKGAIVH